MMKLQHTHHGMRTELKASVQASAPGDLIVWTFLWLPASVVAVIIGLLIALGVELSGLWLVNEWLMAQHIVLIGLPIWAVLCTTASQIYRRGTWEISVHDDELELRWRRLGRGTTWTLPMRSIREATLEFDPLRLVLHFRDGMRIDLHASGHWRGQIQPLADAISQTAKRSHDRPEVTVPDPPRALLSLLSKRTESQ